MRKRLIVSLLILLPVFGFTQIKIRGSGHCITNEGKIEKGKITFTVPYIMGEKNVVPGSIIIKTSEGKKEYEYTQIKEFLIDDDKYVHGIPDTIIRKKTGGLIFTYYLKDHFVREDFVGSKMSLYATPLFLQGLFHREYILLNNRIYPITDRNSEILEIFKDNPKVLEKWSGKAMYIGTHKKLIEMVNDYNTM